MNDDRLARFRSLHERGMFLMPNPWDVGSATMLAERGFPALATTSAGFAWALGKQDQQVTFDELLTHAEALAAAVDVPLNVDAERCYADDLAGVARTVELLAATGAAGCSIEDYDPATKAIDERAKAVDRVAAAAQSAHEHGIVLTARAENVLYGLGDLDDTIARLCAYRDAGAEVLYAPGLVDIAQIALVVREVGRPINVLRMPGAPSLPDLAATGVRRISTGGSLAKAAYATLRAGASEMLAAMPT
ncbi:MAG: isocitrate lyase/phosphoenolpyruvate mutase family protein [Ilumatobacteraceae bacterium]